MSPWIRRRPHAIAGVAALLTAAGVTAGTTHGTAAAAPDLPLDDPAPTTSTTTSQAVSTGSISLQSASASPALTDAGTDTFQLAPSSSATNPAQLNFSWAYGDGGQPVTGSTCTVNAELNGPDGFDQQVHSTDCAGSPAAPFAIPQAGYYTLSAQIIGPGGGVPASAMKTITILAPGSGDTSTSQTPSASSGSSASSGGASSGSGGASGSSGSSGDAVPASASSGDAAASSVPSAHSESSG